MGTVGTESLHAVGYSEVANGALLDNIRRVVCFGFQLARLDIRQVASPCAKAR
jgi:phosphoenolpyruvate carboxylase